MTRLTVSPEGIVRHRERETQILHVAPAVGLEKHEVAVELGIQPVQVVEKVQEVVVAPDEPKEEGCELRLYLMCIHVCVFMCVRTHGNR